jgi:hypothetical protein
MRQLVYISTLRPTERDVNLSSILKVSQSNNLRAKVSGLLFFNGKRFLQALEGTDEAVAATFDRIRADPRHYALVTLSDRFVEQREFGEWAMAYQMPSDPDGERAFKSVDRLVQGASPLVRATFNSFAELKPIAAHAGR